MQGISAHQEFHSSMKSLSLECRIKNALVQRGSLCTMPQAGLATPYYIKFHAV
jgi:hypothetical protein